MKSELRARLQGRFEPPGDKSIGHRLALLSAVATGRSRLEAFPPGQDCASTLGVLRALSVEISRDGEAVEIEGRGLLGLTAPETVLDCGNSGSTARMASGLLAGQAFTSRLSGDESLSRRPLDRVVVPLSRMGAAIETTGGFLPMTIAGRKLRGIDYELPMASAQVKTAVLFAGLYAEGVTRVKEPVASRNHTELALLAFGASPVIRPGEIEIRGGSSLSPGRFRIPGDFSSAAFFIGAAAFLAGSELVVDNVGLNPTRAAFLEALKAMGADIEVEAAPSAPTAEEPQGRVVVRGRELEGVEIPREKIPALIDELPILAVVAAFASGTTRVEGASELRVKESDRLSAIVEGLRALGAEVTEYEDGFEIRGAGRGGALRPARLRSFGDHRMVMAWAVAALGVDGECAIDQLDQVKISYPGFWQTLDRLVC